MHPGRAQRDVLVQVKAWLLSRACPACQGEVRGLLLDIDRVLGAEYVAGSHYGGPWFVCPQPKVVEE